MKLFFSVMNESKYVFKFMSVKGWLASSYWDSQPPKCIEDQRTGRFRNEVLY